MTLHQQSLHRSQERISALRHCIEWCELSRNDTGAQRHREALESERERLARIRAHLTIRGMR